MRIVIPEGAEFVQKPEHLDPLRKLGEVVICPGGPRDKADFIARVKDADVVILDYSLMDEEVLAQCRRLRFVAFLGIGYASCIDIDAATRRGIVVSNTPDYGATSVAEHALGMILALTRHIATAYVSLREGRWEPGRFQGRELRGKVLGLVGLGPIGQEMARLGAGIGMELVGWTRRATPDRARHGLVLLPLEEVFGRADVVSIHLSLRPETEHLVSRALLERMRPEAYFVNTARARIVDTAALADLLRAGRIAGAALDVHDEEPVPASYVFRDLPNVLITPHIGYNTAEASLNMLNIAIATVAAHLKGERLNVVNPAAFDHRR
ncbi:MAG TPA: NAD(P)-dependent oxidoreductase [Methylomirabilota bacterium]|nr:NAD(P)-dependent oxidoreductase [Methylomirabilota bacterium]